MQPAVTPRVSVVVASHRSAYVKDLADAFAGQLTSGTFGGGIEVIIVADYPVEKYQRLYPAVRWVFHGDRGIGIKRNVGSGISQGDILAFIDDDCIPAPGWIGQGLLYLDNNKESAGCEGRTVLELGAIAAPVAEFKRLEKAGFRTNNIFYRKSVFESAGGFDERFTFQREDADLAFSVLSLGHTIGYCPEAMVTHRMRSNENWDLLKNCVNRRFDPLLYKKHPFLYRKHIGSPIPPGIGCVMAFHVGLLLVLAVSIALWPVAAALDCLAALVLSVRRNRSGKNGFFWIVRDFISFLAAPFVIEGALLYGSVKFRKWLIF
jgi:glycosyltransferase involved in cell wall biosynthesis